MLGYRWGDGAYSSHLKIQVGGEVTILGCNSRWQRSPMWDKVGGKGDNPERRVRERALCSWRRHDLASLGMTLVHNKSSRRAPPVRYHPLIMSMADIPFPRATAELSEPSPPASGHGRVVLQAVRDLCGG